MWQPKSCTSSSDSSPSPPHQDSTYDTVRLGLTEGKKVAEMTEYPDWFTPFMLPGGDSSLDRRCVDMPVAAPQRLFSEQSMELKVDPILVSDDPGQQQLLPTYTSSTASPIPDQAPSGAALPIHGHWLARSPPRSVTSSTLQNDSRTHDDSLDGAASCHLAPARKASSLSALSWLLHGGPRPLPFSSIPIESTRSATAAYEFWKHVWIPVKQKSLSPSAFIIFRARIQVALQDEMLFDQMMAYSLLMQNMDKSPKQRMTASILHHSNRSLAQLRERLQSPNPGDRLSGAVIQTIVLLVALHHTCAEIEPLNMHLQALHHLIDLSVGQRKLEWKAFVEGEVKQLGIDWNTTVAVHQPASRREQCSPSYPEHPFDSILYHRIAQFNPGFCELALRSRLSLQFMLLLEGVLDMAQEQHTPATVSHCFYGTVDDLASNPELPTLERVLAVALLVCCLPAARMQGTIPPIVELSIQAHARSFPPGRTSACSESLEEEALDWAALVVCLNMQEGSIAWTWANKRIRLATGELFTKSYQRKLEKNFLSTGGCEPL